MEFFITELWEKIESAEASICWLEGSGTCSHDADDKTKMSKCIDGITEWRVFIYSAYFPACTRFKKKQKILHLCVVYTPVVCSGAVSETGGVAAATLCTEQKRSTRFISGLSLLSRRLQHIRWEGICRTATRRRGKNNFSVSQFALFLSPT